MTLAGEASLSGVGLFTGERTSIRLSPSEGGVEIARGWSTQPATIEHIERDTGVHNTAIRLGDGVSVVLIEHLMSALAGLGVTDVRVEVDGPEIPAFDGSSAPIVEAIQKAGVCELSGDAPVIAPTTTLRVEGEGGAFVEVAPGDAAEYVYELSFENAAPLGEQRASWDGRATSYASDVAPARTFSFEHEARAMQAAGMFTHLTPRDMLVIGDAGPIDNTYRFENEPARHKLLDLIGDLALAGGVIRGRVRAFRAGHALNHEMAALLSAV